MSLKNPLIKLQERISQISLYKTFEIAKVIIEQTIIFPKVLNSGVYLNSSLVFMNEPKIIALIAVMRVVESVIPYIPNFLTRIELKKIFKIIAKSAVQKGIFESLNEYKSLVALSLKT